jgi:RNA polymerase sigma-70 factor, ECF subfamily
MTQCRPRMVIAILVHAVAPTAADWRRITALYDQLMLVAGSPVVALNRAVAVAMVEGPEAGLALMDELTTSGELAGYHLLHAGRADLLRRLGRSAEAAAAYRQALALADNPVEHGYLNQPPGRGRPGLTLCQERMTARRSGSEAAAKTLSAGAQPWP